MGSVIPEGCIQEIKGFIQTREFIRALKSIEAILSKHPHSAQLLALKAFIYERTGHGEAVNICLDAEKELLTGKELPTENTSVLLDVLNTLQIVFQRLGRNDLATRYCEKVCAKFPISIDLMMGPLCCYVRETSYVNQLKTSFKMYKLVQERRFLLWAVFSIQLQVFYHLLKKHVPDCNFDQPEGLLVYMSVKEEQAKDDLACEILSKLDSTLLVAKVGRRHIKRGRLLSSLCDYAAAAEVLRQKFDSCPDDWDCVLADLTQCMEDVNKWCGATDNNAPRFFVCKLSQLSEGKVDSQISEITRSCIRAGHRSILESSLRLAEEYKLKEAVDEYFGRLGSNVQPQLQVLTIAQQSWFVEPLQVLTIAEESWLIENLRSRTSLTYDALEENFGRLHTTSIITERCGIIPWGMKSVYHGTSIALRTKEFIIVASDGKFTMKSSYDALSLDADKFMTVDDMCMTVTGDWKNSTKTLSTLRTCMGHYKDEGVPRLAVSKFAKFTKEKLFSHLRKTEVVFCAFDQLKAGEPPVPCISYACEFESFDVEESFFCTGTGAVYANSILSGNVHDDMTENDAIDLVEKALVHANIWDGCTGGWATIYVIKKDKIVKAVARERISTTLWRKHRSFFENLEKRDWELEIDQ